jgi:hypothetical protein
MSHGGGTVFDVGQQTRSDRRFDPVPSGLSHASHGVAGFDGRSAPESVYAELARIILEEAERLEREAVKST